MRNRAGAALLEALVAALLGALVTGTAVLLLQAQTRIARSTSERSERNDAIRSVLQVLRAELQSLEPRNDLRAVARDSVAARIIRGVAVICGSDGTYSHARYRGLRLPDPAKDSALQIGVENVIPILAAHTDSAACSPTAGEDVVSFSWSGFAPVGSMWLIFESGSYHLSGNALRYRRGTESRQPITNEVIDHARSSLEYRAVTTGIAIQIESRQQRMPTRDYISLLNR
ncbi:MAG TPA: hypothetical protein VFO52_01555 [Longimicrobiales bacterium]|nr:hypothetical protein [Longimicrobiales bacterium]